MFTLIVVILGHHFAPTPETTLRHFEETVRPSSSPSPHEVNQLLPTPRGRRRVANCCSYRTLIESRSPEATDKSLMQKKKNMPYCHGRPNTSHVPNQLVSNIPLNTFVRRGTFTSKINLKAPTLPWYPHPTYLRINIAGHIAQALKLHSQIHEFKP